MTDAHAPQPGKGRGVTGLAVLDLDQVLGASVTLLLMSRSVGPSQRTRNAIGLAWDRATRPIRRRVGIDDHTTVETLFQLQAGQSPESVRKTARSVATTEIMPRVHPQIAQIIAANNAVGYATALVTAAPQELARAVADTLDVTYVLAATAEVGADGRFTGRPEAPGEGSGTKVERVDALVKDLGLTLSQVHVYSDSAGSAELLEAAGFKHLVNPSGPLRQRALDMGWAVHDVKPVGWLWASQLPGAGTLGAAAVGMAAGWVLRGRQFEDPANSS